MPVARKKAGLTG